MMNMNPSRPGGHGTPSGMRERLIESPRAVGRQGVLCGREAIAATRRALRLANRNGIECIKQEASNENDVYQDTTVQVGRIRGSGPVPDPGGGATAAERVLNLLCWVGYEEPSMINVFEDKYDVKVNAKTYVGGDQMFTLFTQSRDVYDVVVVDPEYLPKLHAAGRLAKLDRDDYDSGDYFAPFKMFPFTEYDGDLYAVPIRFGSNGLVYNTNHLTPEDVMSYKILWDPKVKGRVGIWDWYLPSMGVLSPRCGQPDPIRYQRRPVQEAREGHVGPAVPGRRDSPESAGDVERAGERRDLGSSRPAASGRGNPAGAG